MDWKFIIPSNGQGERDSIVIPLTFTVICLIISIFSFWVSTFNWALWFWIVFAFLYGLIALIGLIIMLIILLGR